MTLAQFYAVLGKCLKQTPEARIVIHPEKIRIMHQGTQYCPLTFIPHVYGTADYTLEQYLDAAHTLAMGQGLGIQIGHASDTRRTGYAHIADIRTRLKRVVSRFKKVGEL